MRIIGGKYKNKLIFMPKGIRPTQNKVRKAIFDIIQDVEGLYFLELFAGSGAVGLEALSRGAGEVVMIENNCQCQLAIKKNIESFKAANCHLYPLETERAIESLHKNRKKFDIIFLDPPYHQELPKKTLQTISAYDILAPDGLIVIQHFKNDDLPDSQGDLTLLKQYGYGDTLLSIYIRKAG